MKHKDSDCPETRQDWLRAIQSISRYGMLKNVICANCKKFQDGHAGDQCLFQATKYVPMTHKQMAKYLHELHPG